MKRERERERESLKRKISKIKIIFPINSKVCGFVIYKDKSKNFFFRENKKFTGKQNKRIISRQFEIFKRIKRKRKVVYVSC